MFQEHNSILALSQEAERQSASLLDALLSHPAPVSLPEPRPALVEKPKRAPKSKSKRKRKRKGGPRSGRPSTKQWHEKREVRVNGRRQPVRRTLSDEEHRLIFGDRDLPAADARARHLKRPFTVYVVLKPARMADTAPELRKRAWDKALGAMHKALERLGVMAWTYAAIRESCADLNNGQGEHLNALLHVPKPAIGPFIAWLDRRWGSEVHAQEIRSASCWLRNGCYGSVLLYGGKNMTPKKTWKRNVIRRKGGPIMGKRAWVSMDLRPEAFAEWQRIHRA